MNSLFKRVPNYPCTLLNSPQNFTVILNPFIKYFLLEFKEELLHNFLVLSSRNHHFSSNLISFVFIKKSPSKTESNLSLIWVVPCDSHSNKYTTSENLQWSFQHRRGGWAWGRHVSSQPFCPCWNFRAKMSVYSRDMPAS